MTIICVFLLWILWNSKRMLRTGMVNGYLSALWQEMGILCMDSTKNWHPFKVMFALCEYHACDIECEAWGRVKSRSETSRKRKLSWLFSNFTFDSRFIILAYNKYCLSLRLDIGLHSSFSHYHQCHHHCQKRTVTNDASSKLGHRLNKLHAWNK